MPEPIRWYQSSQIRMAVGLLVPAVVSTIHIFHWEHKLGIDIDQVSSDAILGILTALGYIATTIAYPIIAAVSWIVKRVKAGADPTCSAAPIATPGAVVAATTVVQRLTHP